MCINGIFNIFLLFAISLYHYQFFTDCCSLNQKFTEPLKIMIVPWFPLFSGWQKNSYFGCGGEKAASEWWISFQKPKHACKNISGDGNRLQIISWHWVWASWGGRPPRAGQPASRGDTAWGAWMCSWVARAACGVPCPGPGCVSDSVSPAWDRGAGESPWAGLSGLSGPAGSVMPGTHCGAAVVWVLPVPFQTKCDKKCLYKEWLMQITQESTALRGSGFSFNFELTLA